MAYGSVLTDVVQSSVTGSPPQFNDGTGTQTGTLCRAWVNYKGTATQSIRGSFNVSSVTYNTTADYTINFTNALPDANYSALATTSQNTSGNLSNVSIGYADYSSNVLYSTTQIRFYVHWGNAIPQADMPTISVAVFR